MSIYQEILNWSQNKPVFLKDALRRIISSSSITQIDIDELSKLLKKEQGDTSVTLNAVAIDSTHIPTLINSGVVFPKLVSIKDPINISALHNQGNLQFSNNGLTVIYGGNGSGKSSYSRILKKLCWSRNPSIDLKKNVFTPSPNPQSVDFILEVNGVDVNFQWTENSPSHTALSSIYLFDTECGNVYINKENPTEYKPIGIDVLEKLISVLNSISQNLSSEIVAYNTAKPVLDPSLAQTITGRWYAGIETLAKTQIENFIQLTQTEIDRKLQLFDLLTNQNPQSNIQNLNGLKARIENYVRQFKVFEGIYSQQNLQEITELRTNYESIKQSYDIASNELNNFNTIEGFGTNPWRTLWNSAKNFAISNGMSDGENFPSGSSLKKCVLCQQELTEIAKNRLEGFNQFIMNDVSTQMNAVQLQINQRINLINSVTISAFENFSELSQHIPDFQNQYTAFKQSVELIKSSIVTYLKNGGELNVEASTISNIIESLTTNIQVQLDQNNQLLQNRTALVAEHNELIVKEFLFNNKQVILRYYEETKYKNWINSCISQLNTSVVSRKIGDLMENQAVNLQHQEFIKHLNHFNKDLATKVLLSKTRTSQGNTFQKCGLTGLTDTINSILSEGEQKIIALSNFLAECTIDGRKNTIIFDDPVTSLDMDYRDLIANKIVELSSDRQIIILTHDLSFFRLIIDTHKTNTATDCHIIGIDKYDGVSGIVTDEIPYLAKNVQERIDSIRKILRDHDSLAITDAHGRETKLDSARKRFRMLLERSVEEILSNKTYERFSKNINLKKGNLSSYIITEQSDVDLLLALFGKYSVTEHDGGTSTISQPPNKIAMEQDIIDYSAWKDSFKAKLKTFVASYN